MVINLIEVNLKNNNDFETLREILLTYYLTDEIYSFAGLSDIGSMPEATAGNNFLEFATQLKVKAK